VEEYVAALDRGLLPGEWRALLPLITVKESFFYRTPEHFAAIARVVIPRLAEQRRAIRRLSIWSAGCSRGEEPWTLAMVLAQAPELAGWEWQVTATDVDEEALASAREGAYGERAVRMLPAQLRAAFLNQVPGGFQVSPTLRDRVRFHHQNLVQDPPPAGGAPFDLVMLRNVLIYFSPEVQKRVVARIENSLTRDGYLFVGPSETLWPVTQALQPMDLGDCFCYQPTSRPAERLLPNPSSRAAAQSCPQGQRPSPVLKPATAAAARRPTRPCIEGLPRAAAENHRVTPEEPTFGPDLVIERISAGELEAAAAALAVARDRDAGNPELHALAGLVHDLLGAVSQAQACYRAALYLDAQLFQVHLLLAQSLRRTGKGDRAYAEFRQVLALLTAGQGRPVTSLTKLDQPDTAAAVRICLDALQPTS